MNPADTLVLALTRLRESPEAVTVERAVGLALADLLEAAAKAAEDALLSLPVKFVAARFARELAVARAILGTDQRHSAQPGTDTAPGDQGTVAP